MKKKQHTTRLHRITFVQLIFIAIGTTAIAEALNPVLNIPLLILLGAIVAVFLGVINWMYSRLHDKKKGNN